MSPGRVLVTGGAGFVGSHVCDAYLEAGWDVTAVDNLSTGRAANLSPEVRLVRLDIRDPQLSAAFREGKFDVVNHHAAQASVRESVGNPRHDASVNLDGLLNVVGQSVKYGVQRFVLISSGGVVYGEPGQIPTPRTAPKRPLSPYGVSKLASEYYMLAFSRLYGIGCATLRYSNVYGPRQRAGGEAGVAAIFMDGIRRGESLAVFGGGGQTRDYVFVSDVAAANLAVTGADLPPPDDIDSVAFNVGTEVETSVLELARMAMATVGRTVEVTPARPRDGELERSALDCSETRALGWTPETSLPDGLAQTWESMN